MNQIKKYEWLYSDVAHLWILRVVAWQQEALTVHKRLWKTTLWMMVGTLICFYSGQVWVHYFASAGGVYIGLLTIIFANRYYRALKKLWVERPLFYKKDNELMMIPEEEVSSFLKHSPTPVRIVFSSIWVMVILSLPTLKQTIEGPR